MLRTKLVTDPRMKGRHPVSKAKEVKEDDRDRDPNTGYPRTGQRALFACFGWYVVRVKGRGG